MRICPGIMIAARVSHCISARPLNRVCENAKAAIAEMSTVSAVTSTATTRLFHIHSSRSLLPSTFS